MVRQVFDILLCCLASRKPITSVENKFVARQVETPMVIRAAKAKFVAESRTRVYFAQHVASTWNTVTMCFNLQCNEVARQVEEKCRPYYWTFKLTRSLTDAK